MKTIENLRSELAEALRLAEAGEYHLVWRWLEQAEDTLVEIEHRANAAREQIINEYNAERM